MADDLMLSHPPIQKFVSAIGDQVLKYVGKNKTCVIGYGDDGFFYGQGMYEWLKKKGVPVVFTTVDQWFNDLDEEQVRERKVLVVDNDIVTGTSYRHAMERLRALERALDIKGIKYAVMCDRTNLADFVVEDYASSAGSELMKIDSKDFTILQILGANGRVSYADIGKKTGLTLSGAKKRTERMMRDKIFEVRGRVTVARFYKISAVVLLTVQHQRLQSLVKKLEKSPLAIALVRLYGSPNLMVTIIASGYDQVSEFVDKNIAEEPGVASFSLSIGDLPAIPLTK